MVQKKETQENLIITIEMMSKPGCHLCDVAWVVIQKTAMKYSLKLLKKNIEEDNNLFSQFQHEIPVIFINGKKCFKYRITQSELEKRLDNFLSGRE